MIKRRRFPLALRLLLALTGFIAIQGWGRAWTALSQADQYESLHIIPPLPLYITFFGGWGLVFAMFSIALWRRLWWAYQWLIPLLSVYAITILAWYAYFARSDYAQTRFPFVVITSIGGLGFIWWLSQRPNVKLFFSQNHSLHPLGEVLP